MVAVRKLYEKLKASPANCPFNDLVAFLTGLGFTQKRQKGSHMIFGHPDHPREIVNIQRVGKEAKPFQVKQVLSLVENLDLMED